MEYFSWELGYIVRVVLSFELKKNPPDGPKNALQYPGTELDVACHTLIQHLKCIHSYIPF